MKQLHTIISGKVQGVWFRQSCADEANRLGLAGWARNLAGGGVEAVFEGDEKMLALMVEWCHQGPRLARVDGVDITENAPEGLTPPFTVRS